MTRPDPKSETIPKIPDFEKKIQFITRIKSETRCTKPEIIVYEKPDVNRYPNIQTRPEARESSTRCKISGIMCIFITLILL